MMGIWRNARTLRLQNLDRGATGAPNGVTFQIFPEQGAPCLHFPILEPKCAIQCIQRIQALKVPVGGNMPNRPWREP
eukprot:1159852-Pelagomonas_calceolata.AAC.10